MVSGLVSSAALADATDDEVAGDQAPPPAPAPARAGVDAFPVSQVDLSLTKHQSADLGEVLSRSPGLNIRRTGGLGSPLVLGLYGAQGDAVRVLWNDLPLELQGYSQSVADLPLFQLARVDVYRGVAPIRLGVDAREGVLNVIAPLPERPIGADGYYQIGSFGTHRAGVSGHYRHAPTGLFTRLTLYGDLAKNDYDVTVQEVEPDGTAREATRSLFHNRYRAAGGDVEVGITKRPWAEHLTLRAFAQRLDRDIQTNALYTIPYGEARTHTENMGVQLRFAQTYLERLRVEAVAGYTRITNTLVDEGNGVYDWRGEVVQQRSRPGELSVLGSGSAQRDELYGRVHLAWSSSTAHALQLTLTPRHTSWSGQAARGDARMFTMISGLAYVLTLFDGKLENHLFGKSYLQSSSSSLRVSGMTFARDQTNVRFGVGDALRVQLAEAWQLRVSYELATRLPTAFDLYGDGGLYVGNSELKAESSHNGNLELLFAQATSAGGFRAGANVFARKVDNEVLTIAGTGAVSSQNVLRARTIGLEGRLGWSAPGEWLALDANLTFADAINESREGPTAIFRGDRLPGRPWLYANATARTSWGDVLATGDEVSLSYYYRFVNSHERGWQSLGGPGFGFVNPSVHLHTLALTYLAQLRDVRVGGSLEAQNLGDERSHGTWGAQLPGRAYYLKLDVQL